MVSPLLKTKLLAPPVRENLVSRQRLLVSLDALKEAGRKLGLVAAPAGYGKTTLIGAWLADRDFHPAWLSLDSNDNDPVRFLAYLVAACREAVPGLAETTRNALTSPQVTPVSVLPLLINDLAAISRPAAKPLIVVLDDYHEISNSKVHHVVIDLLEASLPGVRFLFVTRADPPFPLPRFRARNQLVEIRSADLQFTADEAASFLNEAMGLSLSDAAVDALERRTEGWVTGLQMAALSLQHYGDPEAFITRLSGTHRYILDYLVEEVLEVQTPELQSFLLHTSVLERLSGPLCAAVKGPSLREGLEAQSILEKLDQANLFVVPLDDYRTWYRYHRLFRDLLRARAQVMLGDAIPSLHLKASQWYEDQGLLEDAVHHAITSQDLTRLTDLIERYGLRLLMQGELRSLLGWISALPASQVEARARLCLLHAWVLLLTGRLEAAVERADLAERLLETQRDAEFAGQAAAIRAYAAAQQGDVKHAVEEADRALTALSQDNAGIRAVVHFVLGGIGTLRGDLQAARHDLSEAAALGQQSGNLHVAVPALNSLAEIELAQGQLRRAQATANHAVALGSSESGRPLPIAGGAVSALADLAYEWNDLDRALVEAKQSVELSKQWGSAESEIYNTATLVRVLSARGELDAAREAMMMAQERAEALPSNAQTSAALRLALGELRLAQGSVSSAETWLAASPPMAASPLEQEEALVRAKLHLMLGQSVASQEVLAELLAQTRIRDLVAPRIEALALQAALLAAQGERATALGSLREALALGRPEGFVRRIVSQGRFISGLLGYIGQTDKDPALSRYAGRLADMCEGPGVGQAESPLIEPLSEREREVLTVVAEGLTNQEIAQKLFIAESTVKSHLNHIYGKLDVRNRTQAVAQARALRLLDVLS